MSKKKTSKGKKPPAKQDDALRNAIADIVSDLYVEVEKQAGIRIDALRQRCDELTERLEAVEGCCHKPEPTTWLGRLHRRRWFCFPWCRY